jgi:mediator of RNA polymerase II transcription subunit 5
MRSPELQMPVNVDMLCRLGLQAHYASGRPPLGSVVHSGDSLATVLDRLRDGFGLLQLAYSIPPSQFHHPTTSASELLSLLLPCVDLPNLTLSQAVMYYSQAVSLLNLPLLPNVRHHLDNFIVALSLVKGDNDKAVRDVQMAQNFQLSLNGGEAAESLPDSDLVAYTLVLHHLVGVCCHQLLDHIN